LLFSTNIALAEDIHMLFVGDVMLDELPGKLIQRGGDPFASFANLFQQADIKIGNLECAIGTRGRQEKKVYTFRANPRVTQVIKKYFSAVSLANNHSGDYGPQAFATMLDLLDREHIAYFGGGRDIRSAHQPFIVESHGKKIAILGYDEFLPRSFEALTDRPGVAWSDDDYVLYDIKNAKTKYQADIVIVYPHWGWEYQKTASPRQERLAHLMIDAGADIVIGGHPHVTQNIETYKGKPVFYSLGNFVFNGFEDLDTTTGWALELTISADKQINWKVHVARLDKNGSPQYAGVLQQNH
jgi:poly-gamma-glutamate synthesis protein (capsule biosynthesis protein)